MKFDMSAAWNEALRLIAANRQVVAVVAGVFFFLPAVIYGLSFTNQITAIQGEQGTDASTEAAFKAVAALLDDVWWIIILTMIVQWIGTLILVILWTDRSRPTVGDAIKLALALLPPLLGGLLLMFALWGLLALLPFAIGAGGATGVAVLVGFAAGAALAYTYVKFSLFPVVIGSQRMRNPLAALGQSWRMTKGNSLRIFAFMVLLAAALVVISSVAGMVSGLLLALAGADVALTGQTLVSGVISAAFSVLFVAILVAIYHQLTGGRTKALDQTFG